MSQGPWESVRAVLDSVGRLPARVRSLWRGASRRDEVEAEMREEMERHIEMRTEDLIRDGMPREEAARQARLEFGHVETHREEARVSRGLVFFDRIRFSWLDVKLGFRMLVRYPGLTVVGVMAMAFAIWVGAGTFELVNQVLFPSMPLDEDDRIVAVQVQDTRSGGQERRVLWDLERWRGDVRTLEDLGAYRGVLRNLFPVSGDAATGPGSSAGELATSVLGEPVTVAEITPSAFRLTRVPPLHGRFLLDSDDDPGAASVAVLGFELWRERFDGDQGVVGRDIRIGPTVATVVGVMPDGYAFPVRHQIWIPLSESEMDVGPREGPGVSGVFGRLAPGASLDQARAELATWSRRAEADDPESRAGLEVRVLPYAFAALGVPPDLWSVVRGMLLSWNLVPILLLLLICGNVALLIFARATAREAEIAVRSALGAGRARIVGQLFVEALALGTVAMILGLVAVDLTLEWAIRTYEGISFPAPFWIEGNLSAPTVLYAALFTILGAGVAGVVPALKVTRGVGAQLKKTAPGAGSLRFGGIWTAVIVTQVALTVAFPAVTYFLSLERDAFGLRDIGVPTEEVLTARLAISEQVPTEQRSEILEAIARRLREDPRVAAVTYSNNLPLRYHGWNQIEVEDGAAPPPDERGHRVSRAVVEPGFFQAFDAPVLLGRGFVNSDLAESERVVIVNESFVERVLGGANPIGRRIRYVARESDREPASDPPWFEIVGVVRDLGTRSGYGWQGIYHPAEPIDLAPSFLSLRVAGGAEAFSGQLRATAVGVDPGLMLTDVQSLARINQDDVDLYNFWVRILAAFTGITLVLSLAGIFSVMSFTVTRRTREIGVRVALGGSAGRVVLAILRRPLLQVGGGVVIGTAFVCLFGTQVVFGTDTGIIEAAAQVGRVALYGLVMAGVCMLACIVPTRRALSVEPAEALNVEG